MNLNQIDFRSQLDITIRANDVLANLERYEGRALLRVCSNSILLLQDVKISILRDVYQPCPTLSSCRSLSMLAYERHLVQAFMLVTVFIQDI